MEEINDMICELLDLDVTDGEEIKFTRTASELIHKIAVKCNQIPIVNETKEQAEAYGEGLSAEEVYLDMCRKIVSAPTRIHTLMSARMLIPIIDRKLREEGS